MMTDELDQGKRSVEEMFVKKGSLSTLTKSGMSAEAHYHAERSLEKFILTSSILSPQTQ